MSDDHGNVTIVRSAITSARNARSTLAPSLTWERRSHDHEGRQRATGHGRGERPPLPSSSPPDSVAKCALIDLDEHRGDVVFAATFVGEVDEALHRGVAAHLDDAGDVGVLEVAVQAVAAEQKARGRNELNAARIDLHVLAVSDSARDDVAVRGPRGLGGRDEALFQLPGDEG